jgi:hypothetical protein
MSCAAPFILGHHKDQEIPMPATARDLLIEKRVIPPRVSFITSEGALTSVYGAARKAFATLRYGSEIAGGIENGDWSQTVQIVS